MPRFEPFAGLRFASERVGALDGVSCPPYDAITPALRRALLARSPYNVVRLVLAEEGGDRADAHLDRERRSARDALDAWRATGALVREPEPAFYGYRTTAPAGTRDGQQTIGLIGALDLEDPGTGILPHEETTEGSSAEHRRRLEALRVNVSPIWTLTPARGLAALAGAPPAPDEATAAPAGMQPAGMQPGPAGEAEDRAGGHLEDGPAPGPRRPPLPPARTVDEEGVVHELWPITDPDRVAAIRRLVGSEPLVLADGHHRYETALDYHRARAAEGHPDDGSGAIMTWVVELSEEQLHVQAIHRLVHAPDVAKLLETLAQSFALEPAGPPDQAIGARMAAAGALAVITPAGTWLARPSAAWSPAAAGLSASDDLDSRRLDLALADLPEARVSYQPGWAEAAAAVADARADAAVLLRPPSVRQIADIGRGGVRMPAKTTFFWPKPRTGLVLRELGAL